MIELQPIGTIYSPFKETAGTPIQPAAAKGARGRVEIFEPYRPGLRDLDSFSHIILIYVFHRCRGYDLEVVPFMDTEPRGLFATRAPRRPNPLGLSVVRLERVAGGVLHIAHVDILDGTPLLDIKPYVPAFDSVEQVRVGWLEGRLGEAEERRADGRFT
jgi:tRNA (adenine37-N6)-methyltransferase